MSVPSRDAFIFLFPRIPRSGGHLICVTSERADGIRDVLKDRAALEQLEV
jgi:hypothetical protein